MLFSRRSSAPARSRVLAIPIRRPVPVAVEDAEERRAVLPAALVSRRKRIFDIVGASLVLIVTAPLLVLIAALIRLTSPGPILFRQERIGVDSRSFTMLKFRTMHDGATDAVHRTFVLGMVVDEPNGVEAPDGIYKLGRDARVTRLGRILRAASLDELPQLINVLRGEMSLIGPRPPLHYEVEAYEPWQYERLTVRPGITGLWQVSGRNRLTYREMCRLDIEYIRTWSFRRDLAIALRTPVVMFFSRGGAR